MSLKPGRGYEEAVTKFQPYKEIQEINEEARLHINNRLEGFAPRTIAEIIRRLIEQGRRYVLIR